MCCVTAKATKGTCLGTFNKGTTVARGSQLVGIAKGMEQLLHEMGLLKLPGEKVPVLECERLAFLLFLFPVADPTGHAPPYVCAV